MTKPQYERSRFLVGTALLCAFGMGGGLGCASEGEELDEFRALSEKTWMCHVSNASLQAIEISPHAVDAHIGHGDWETVDVNGDDAIDGSDEVCGDGVDNDCDGEIDEDCCPCFSPDDIDDARYSRDWENTRYYTYDGGVDGDEQATIIMMWTGSDRHIFSASIEAMFDEASCGISTRYSGQLGIYWEPLSAEGAQVCRDLIESYAADAGLENDPPEPENEDD